MRHPYTPDTLHVARGFVPDSEGYYETFCGEQGDSSHVYALSTCISCLVRAGRLDYAGLLRRVELDSELRAMGALIIRVKDLGAALEAREKGGQAITLCRGTVAAPAARVFARHAASLARLALGDAS